MTAKRPSKHLAFETPEHSVPPSPQILPENSNALNSDEDLNHITQPQSAMYPLPLQRHEKQAQTIIESVTESSNVSPHGVLSYLLRLQSEKASTVIDMDAADTYGTSSAHGYEMQTMSSNIKNRSLNETTARRASLKEEQQLKIKESIADVLTKHSFLLK
jgi:hypothetical protein